MKTVKLHTIRLTETDLQIIDLLIEQARSTHTTDRTLSGTYFAAILSQLQLRIKSQTRKTK